MQPTTAIGEGSPKVIHERAHNARRGSTSVEDGCHAIDDGQGRLVYTEATSRCFVRERGGSDDNAARSNPA
jgi:hypothetical protein